MLGGHLSESGGLLYMPGGYYSGGNFLELR
jgi:hypothetical protein